MLSPPELRASYVDHLEEISHVETVLLKTVDLHENAGSLIRKYGRVPASLFLKLVLRHRPAMDVVADSLVEHHDGEGATNAIEALMRAAEDLNALAGYLEQDQP